MVPYFSGSRLIASAYSIAPETSSAIVFSICFVQIVMIATIRTSHLTIDDL
jgi:hypothetical protein